MKIITRALEIEPQYDMRSICSPEEMLLFDIETTGLKKETTQLYMIGCAFYRDDTWYARQWLTENTSDELTVLEDFLEFASDYKTLVHFNGDGFDIPYMQYKADYYGTGFDFGRFESFDIYKTAKKARKLLAMESMSQKSVEVFLGINRDDQMNGGLLIPVYYEYEKTASPELENLLLLHNFDDIQGMLKILPMLTYQELLNDQYEFIRTDEAMDTAILEYRIKYPVPVARERLTGTKDINDILICMDNDILQINIKIYQGTGLLPLENVCDYYYIPEEDRVIHKDVAQFMDKSKRVKATKKNCFIKKTGRFIPQRQIRITPAFNMNDDRKRTYIDWDELKNCTDSAIFMNIAHDILHGIGC